MTVTEPQDDRDVEEWIAQRLGAVDPFADVAAATEVHRGEHGCDAYVSDDGPLLGVLARATRARRSLEVGTALGYTALWIAYGASEGRVDTIDRDPDHVALARTVIERAGYADRVTVHEGEAAVVLGELDGPFDLIFYDAFVPTPSDLEAFERLLRPGGVLVSSNLFLGRYVPGLSQLEEGARYREALVSGGGWLTAFSGHKAVSVRS